MRSCLVFKVESVWPQKRFEVEAKRIESRITSAIAKGFHSVRSSALFPI